MIRVWSYGKTEKESERIQKNVSNLLSIYENEVPFDRMIGLNPDWIDKPITEITSDLLTEMEDLIEEKEPRAQISIEDVLQKAFEGQVQIGVVIDGII